MYRIFNCSPMKIRKMLAFGVFVTILLCEFAFLIQMLNLTHPTITICLAAIFTAFACNSWRTAVMCILGIVVYIAGSFAHNTWHPSTLNLFAIKCIHVVGVGIWSYGIYRAFQKTWNEKSRDRHLS